MKGVGILALQGDFAAHSARLRELGAETVLVRRGGELTGLSALIMPGGESTTMLKLMDRELRAGLEQAVRGGLPTLATCAGVILLAKRVEHPAQESLALMDLDVTRNAHGRQVDSCLAELKCTGKGSERLARAGMSAGGMRGVFIRAPRITRIGRAVEVLLCRGGDPVLVQSGNIVAATFHPELSDGDAAVHRYLLSL